MITIKLTGSGGVSGPTIKFANSQRSLLRVQDMQHLGDFGVATVKQRAMSGLGSSGAPMPALKATKVVAKKNFRGKVQLVREGYAAWKANHGLHPYRDLVGDGSQGGHMLDNFTVRSVTETDVKMAFTKKHQREKALGNEKRAPFLGFAPQDRVKITAEAARLFAVNVREVGFFGALKVFRKAS